MMVMSHDLLGQVELKNFSDIFKALEHNDSMTNRWMIFHKVHWVYFCVNGKFKMVVRTGISNIIFFKCKN
jgi:hypothetical protein